MPYAAQAKSWSETVRKYKDEVRLRPHPGPECSPARYARHPREALSLKRPLNAPPPPRRELLYESHGDLQFDKWDRNGWGVGDTASRRNPVTTELEGERAVAKEGERSKKLAGSGLRRVPGIGPGTGANRPPPLDLHATRKRKDLFMSLHHRQTAPGADEEADAWVGHKDINPAEGKRPVSNHESRKRMFEVLGYTAKAPLPRLSARDVPKEEYEERSDSWVGNKDVDPTKGKRMLAPPLDLDVRRTNGLFDVLNQKKLPIAPVMKRAGYAGFDAWCGHILIDPIKGKGHGEHGDERHDLEMTEMLRHGCSGVDASGKFEDGWIGTSGFDPNRGRGRGALHPPRAEDPAAHLGAGSLFAHDTERPPAPEAVRSGRRNVPPGPSANAEDMFRVTHRRGGLPTASETASEFARTRRALAAPGSSLSGSLMLTWSPSAPALKLTQFPR